MSRIQKRSRVTDESVTKSGKRRKVQNNVANANSLVTDENLQWREVAVPQRLGDAEGFSGLEEIDDVEVIKDKDRNRVQFRVIYPSA
jgi:ATP-dependent RNA helicase DDX24/MAK5